MTFSQQPAPAIACQLAPDDQSARAAHLREQLFARVVSTVELDDGYAYEFPGEDDVLEQLTTFVLVERQCCPFFTFELLVEADRGPATLKLRGPDGTKHFLRGLLTGL